MQKRDPFGGFKTDHHRLIIDHETQKRATHNDVEKEMQKKNNPNGNTQSNLMD